MVKMSQDNYLRCVKMQQQRRAGLFDFSNFRGLVITLNTTYFNFDIPLPSENEVSEKNYDVEGVISYYKYPGHNDAFLLTAPLIPSDETAINTISVSHNDAKTIGRFYKLCRDDF